MVKTVEENCISIFLRIFLIFKSPYSKILALKLHRVYPHILQLQISVQLEWSKKCSALLRIPDEVPEESQVKFPDLMEEAGLLEWAGINIGKAEVCFVVYFIDFVYFLLLIILSALFPLTS